jgi:hypothetical protein
MDLQYVREAIIERGSISMVHAAGRLISVLALAHVLGIGFVSILRLEIMKGNRFIIAFPFAVGFLGVILLFFARLPLYKRRQFFSFGPSGLDQPHRKLYFVAYMLLICSIGSMLLMLCAV